jgi:hypothetical protein
VTRPGVIAVLALLVIAAAGCGVSDPYRARSTPTRATQPSRASSAREDAADGIPRAQVRSRPQPTPAGALRAFASRWDTWSAATATRQQRALAGLATGAWRATLGAGGGSRPPPAHVSRGTVVMVHVGGHGATRDGLAVVTRQRYHQGRPAGPREDRLYRARIRHVRGGWLIAAWTPVGEESG